ncbi:DUF2752 domain-containing protein [Streptomyces sp. NPDC003691]
MDATTPPSAPAAPPALPGDAPPEPPAGPAAPGAGPAREAAAPAYGAASGPPGPVVAASDESGAVPAGSGPPGTGHAPGAYGAGNALPGPFPGSVPGHAPRAPQGALRRLAAPLGTLAAVAAAFAYVGAVDPNEPGHYPACPLLRYTGIYCPGCGGLRSAHAFVHGDLGTALGANAVAVAGYGVFFVLWAVWTVRAARGVPGATWRISVRPVWWWLTGASVLVFSVLRNLPAGSALVP